MLNNHFINTFALIVGILACYYVAAWLEQDYDYQCHDDTECYAQCIELGDRNCE